MVRRAVLVLVALLGCGAAVVSPSAGKDRGRILSKDFTYTGGEQTFVVPAGVTSVVVFAVGARGGDAPGVAGGAGGGATATLGVHRGEKLYVEVGGRGANSDTQPCPGVSGCRYARGGFNGGGSSVAMSPGHSGGGGGGASDVQTRSISGGIAALSSRLVVAPGGGGAGGDAALEGVFGGHGGRKGTSGGDGDSVHLDNNALGGGGGDSADQQAGGSPGKAGGQTFTNRSVYFPGKPGTKGDLGIGGNGGSTVQFQPCASCKLTAGTGAGGGGGGGYYGGGGGGGGGIYECSPAVQRCNPATSPDEGSGGGGGGGSSFTPNGSADDAITASGNGDIQLDWHA